MREFLSDLTSRRWALPMLGWAVLHPIYAYRWYARRMDPSTHKARGRDY